MKFNIITAATLFAIAAAQPYHRHRHLAKREQATTTAVVFETDYVVAYVDQTGSTLSVAFVNTDFPQTPQATEVPSPQGGPPDGYGQPPAPVSNSAGSQPAASSDITEQPSYVPPAPESTEAPAAPSYPSPDTSSVPPPPTPDSTEPGDLKYGISYAPYSSSGNCKTEQEIDNDFNTFSGYEFVRIYGTDCDQVAFALKAASSRGMKLFAGIFDVHQAASEAGIIKNAASQDWDAIYAVSVGNEAVAAGLASATTVKAAINATREYLQGEGYTGPVVTVDTVEQWETFGEELCESDFVAANSHAFFDGNVLPSGAGTFVLGQSEKARSHCPDKRVMITESGWPWQGMTNNRAVPSVKNQQDAIESLKQAFSKDIVLFSAFDDEWKQDRWDTFGAEKWWGLQT